LPQTQKNPILNLQKEMHFTLHGKELMKSSIALLLSVLALAACSSSPMTQLQKPVGPAAPATEEQKMPPTIVGNWRSVDAETFGKKLFMTREYHLSSTRWELIQTYAEDKAMKHTIAIVHSEGPYQILSESKDAGVWQVQMKLGSRGIVLKTKKAKAAKELEIHGCALTYNHERDLTDKSCGPFVSLKDCPQIYDIVKVDSNYLLFGATAEDMKETCSESGRPSALGLPLRKIN
jgi:hypothetical protein